MDVDALVAATYRAEWGRVLATVIRLTGDFDLAEEATQEAFAAALVRWREEGVPEHRRPWLIQTARNLALDRARRRRVFGHKLVTLAAGLETDAEAREPAEIPDDRLRLVFSCCHPALALEAQVALTLRTLVGLETEEIARAFLVPVPTMAQRLVRAKRKIADAGIPYVVPERREMGERLPGVLTVLYLLFNEGYAATRGEPVRVDLSDEAQRLARMVRALLPPPPSSEVDGLLALMLLTDARRPARFDVHGDLVLLEDQDRRRWDRTKIDEALPLLDDADADGPFALQARIAAVHARAAEKSATDWSAIVRLYDRLLARHPSPVVALNRAVAVAMVDGPRAGLAALAPLLADGALDDYHLLHATVADLARRDGDRGRAHAAYARALALAGNEAERRFLARRLDETRPLADGP